jgi:hypothetical protein
MGFNSGFKGLMMLHQVKKSCSIKLDVLICVFHSNEDSFCNLLFYEPVLSGKINAYSGILPPSAGKANVYPKSVGSLHIKHVGRLLTPY